MQLAPRQTESAECAAIFAEVEDPQRSANGPGGRSGCLREKPFRSGYDRHGLVSLCRMAEVIDPNGAKRDDRAAIFFQEASHQVLPPLSLGVCSWSLQVKSIRELKAGFLDGLGVDAGAYRLRRPAPCQLG